MFKKLCLIGICITGVMARAECTSDIGTLITGLDGTDYCLSKVSLNWWSAYSWCRAVGGTFATVDAVCGPNWEFDNCRNLSTVTDFGDAITATPYKSHMTYHLRWMGYRGNYGIRTEHSRRDLVPAICLMP